MAAGAALLLRGSECDLPDRNLTGLSVDRESCDSAETVDYGRCDGTVINGSFSPSLNPSHEGREK